MKKSKIYLLIGSGLFVITSVIYIFALCPSIHPRDNPDAITAAATLGIAHPPGYPLFTILGHLFSKIPISSIPFRVNMMSALFSAATVFIVYLIILKLTKRFWPALIGASILAFSYNYFLQSLYADFLSLNNLLVALEILVILIWREKQEKKYLYLFAFLFGLAFSHHQISFFLFPAFLYLILSTNKKVLISWELPKLIGFFILGLLPYLYLPIRAHENPTYVWGNATTLKGFFDMISRKDYARESFQFINFFASRIFDWFKLLSWRQFTILGFLAGLVGLAEYRKKDKILFYFLLLSVILAGPVFAFFADIPNVQAEMAAMERFFIFSFMLFAIWIGLGVNLFLPKIGKAIPLLLIFPVLLLLYHYPKVNRRHYYYAYDLGKNILNSLPQNAVLYGGLDVPFFELTYLQNVEHFRPDVKILPGFDKSYGEVTKSIEDYTLKNFPDYKLPVAKLAQKYQVYTVTIDESFWGKQTNNFIPEGLVYKYSSANNWAAQFDGTKAFDNLNNYQYRGNYSVSKNEEDFTKEIKYFYLEAWFNLGMSLQQAEKIPQAGSVYQKAIEIDPESIGPQINYASILLERGLYQEAKAKYKEILKNNPDLIMAQNGLNYANQKLSE